MVLPTLRPIRFDRPNRSLARPFERRQPLIPSPPPEQQSVGAEVLRALSAKYASKPAKDTALDSLNDDLAVLVELFPDVKPEVFREMLSDFSEESRRHVVAEQILKYGQKWIKGRLKVETSMPDTRAEDEQEAPRYDRLTLVDKFRTESYKDAVRTVLGMEFRFLTRSVLEGVLAEENFSYTDARESLAGIALRSWKTSLMNFVSRFTRINQTTVEYTHPMLVWLRKPGQSMPMLRDSGDPELNRELQNTILRPLRERSHNRDSMLGLEEAQRVNQEEATKAETLFECECCLSDVPFESVTFCTTGEHCICFSCISRSVNEAVFGQSWDLTIDHERSQIACLAPTMTKCLGCIPHHSSKRAVIETKSGEKIWAKLETRLAQDALLKSQVPVRKCPFCAYAEVDELYLPRQPTMTLNLVNPLMFILAIAISILAAPFLLLYTLISRIHPLPPFQHVFDLALDSLLRDTLLSKRFQCSNPSCLRSSCLTCHKAWRDPHVCHETETLSLRTAIEAARTAALKRTCPRCGLGFIKDSGCNKMICVCGYAMCYVCRKELGQKRDRLDGGPLRQIRNVDRLLAMAEENANAPVEGEGYAHFCQHFRPLGGRCKECDKCDLYRVDDENEIVKRAGLRAEKDWWKAHGKKGEKDEREVEMLKRHVQGEAFTVQDGVNWWVRTVVKYRLPPAEETGK